MEDKNLVAEEEATIITLTDENGVDMEFEYLDCIEYKGKEYLALLPTDEESNEILLLEIVPVDEENESYVSIEDEETLMAVYAILKEHFKGILNFED